MVEAMRDKQLGVLCSLPGFSARVLALAVAILVAQSALFYCGQRSGLTLSPSGVALAREASAKQEKTRKTPALSSAVYEKLTKAQELSEAGDMRGALSLLDGLRDSQGRSKLNSYELANLYNYYAFIFYQREHA